MSFTFKPAVCQGTNDKYPHYLAVLENGPARVVNIWAVRERPTERSLENADRLTAENDRGDAFEVNRTRLCATPATAINVLAFDIAAENSRSYETAIEHGNRELFASLAAMAGQYVEGAIDAAWCQMKAAEMTAEPKQLQELEAMMLETVRNYVEHRLRPFSDHLSDQIQRRASEHTNGLFSVLSERVINVEGQLKIIAEILTPLAKLKAAKPKAANKSTKPKRKR